MHLVGEEGAQILIIDSKLPIAQVIMQSKQNIDILEIKDNIAKINRILDIKDPNIASLAYLTIDGDNHQNMHSRMELKLRTSEGQQGNIQILIMPKNSSGC